jgi:hypothetical protein
MDHYGGQPFQADSNVHVMPRCGMRASALGVDESMASALAFFRTGTFEIAAPSG